MSMTSKLLVQETDDEYSLSKIIYTHLKNQNFDTAIAVIKRWENKNYLINNTLEVVPVLTKILEEDFCTLDMENCLEEILVYIADIANQKEVLLVFLEEVEIFRSKKQFRVILKPLQVILLKQVTKSAKSHTFAWVFNTLNAHICVLPLPKYDNLEGKDRKLLDADPDQQNIVDILHYVFEFYEYFYEKVMCEELVWPDKEMGSKLYLSYFILNLFHRPLSFLDIFCYENESKSSLFIICSKFVSMVTNLLINPFKLLSQVRHQANCKPKDETENTNVSTENEQPELVSQLSLATYFYCIIGQNICESCLPCVYSNEYIFLSCVPLCNVLLEQSVVFTVHKGLILFKALLNKIDNNTLFKDTLNSPSHLNVLNKLVKVMTFCESKECRILAVETMKEWLWKFDSNGRYHLLTIMLSTISHAGILGVVIHEVKENIKLAISNPKLSEQMQGIQLQNIINLACSLPNGETTDMLEWNDKIMSALNLIIFVCLADRQNVTNFKMILPKVKQSFLDPLENGLRISKAHYELKLKDIKENGNSSSDSKINVSIIGENLPGIPKEKEKEVIIQALNWFDTMQSVWARASKLVNEFI